MSASKFDIRQSVLRPVLPFVGNSANMTVDSVFSLIDAEISKLYEDRNILLVSDGTVTFVAAGTSLTFSSNLRLHINSKVAGGAPTVIDLGSTSRTLSASGNMLYAVINRTGGTAVVTSDSTTLPAVVSANQEVVLIAKRVDATDGTKRVYFRNGFTLSAGQTSRIGGGGTVYASEFSIVDPTDTTKQIIFSASGAVTGTTTTLVDVSTSNVQLTLPTVTTTIVGASSAITLTNKTFGDAITFDQISTPSNPPSGADKLYFKNDDNLYKLTSTGVEVQVDAASSSPVGSSSELTNVGLAVTGTTGTFTVALKQNDGVTDPGTATQETIIAFRDAVGPPGAFTRVGVTAPLSVTFSPLHGFGQFGYHIGSYGKAQWVYVWAINNGGTVKLAISGSQFADDNSMQSNVYLSTSQFNATGNPGNVLLSSAAYTNVAVRLIGRFLFNANNDTWTTISITEADLMPFRSTPEYIANTSSSKTPITNTSYLAMTNNNVFLTPGEWILFGQFAIVSNIGTNLIIGAAGWAVANGADSGVQPQSIFSDATFITPATGSVSWFGFYLDGQNNANVIGPVMSVRVTILYGIQIFLVPFVQTPNQTHLTVKCSLWAERSR